MKRFIIKTLFFILPFIILNSIVKILYVKDQGDLLRIGFIFNFDNYRSHINSTFEKLPIKYESISNLDFETKNKFTVLTIGDSFSEQGYFGYKNYIANQEDITVIHIDRYLSKNPVQTLFNLTNSNFFDTIKVDFVVLQSVERAFVQRTLNIDTSTVLSIDSLFSEIKKRPIKQKSKKPYQLFSDEIVKTPTANLLYNFIDKPLDSKTFKVETTTNLFTNKNNTLLFFQGDIEPINTNNDSIHINSITNTLNNLQMRLLLKNINLIVLPSPDKYDVYYDFIKDKKDYPEPLFFKYFNKTQKTFIYINSKGIIKKIIKKSKDAYYYDDTHWSPSVAKEIGLEIANIIYEHKP